MVVGIGGVPLALTFLVKQFTNSEEWQGQFLRFIFFLFNLWFLVGLLWVVRLIALLNDANVTVMAFSLFRTYLWFTIALTVVLTILFILSAIGFLNTKKTEVDE